MAHRKANRPMRYLILIVVCIAIGYFGREGLDYVRTNMHFEPVASPSNAAPASPRGYVISLGDSRITVM